ncbi:MAG: HNH endonuclease [Blastocatellia bacterium]
MSAKRIPESLIRIVIERAQGFCEYCRCPDSFSTDDRFSVDHILSQSKGGSSLLSNLAYSCQGCNGKKGNRRSGIDPLSGRGIGLFNPRRQRWLNHFGWNSDFTMVVGKTPTGRATIASLQLNRRGVVNIRRVLRQTSLHPPIE